MEGESDERSPQQNSHEANFVAVRRGTSTDRNDIMSK
jgi:hypothetical protein